MFIATLPEIAWEASLGVYLIVKGFKPSHITAGNTDTSERTSVPESTDRLADVHQQASEPVDRRVEPLAALDPVELDGA